MMHTYLDIMADTAEFCGRGGGEGGGGGVRQLYLQIDEEICKAFAICH